MECGQFRGVLVLATLKSWNLLLVPGFSHFQILGLRLGLFLHLPDCILEYYLGTMVIRII